MTATRAPINPRFLQCLFCLCPSCSFGSHLLVTTHEVVRDIALFCQKRVSVAILAVEEAYFAIGLPATTRVLQLTLFDEMALSRTN